ncbi:MAG: magnesium/cobalt transporter CorA [Flavobacteriales bacterium]|nr:magnesium/cobalt transporter CorA [Flavobacteriales bacterium]
MEPKKQDEEHFLGSAKKAGLPPGALIYVGKKGNFTPALDAISYTTDNFSRSRPLTPADVKHILKNDGTTWITLYGIHEAGLVAEMGEILQLHPLLLEDILDTTQRPTSELFEDYIFLSLKMMSWQKKSKTIQSEQLSIVLSRNSLVIFEEKPGDIYENLRERIEKGKGILRSKKADYLMYRLIDDVVDQYFIIGEKLQLKIEHLESEILVRPEEAQMHQLLALKKQLMRLRRTILPLRDNVTLIERSNHKLISKDTPPYLRDVSDHVKEVIEMLDMYRESVTNLMDLHMSTTSNQMNQVMKVLTVIATTFIPLTFIVGIYGMNFTNMPELSNPYGYATVWLVMIVVAAGLIAYFRKKKWL